MWGARFTQGFADTVPARRASRKGGTWRPRSNVAAKGTPADGRKIHPRDSAGNRGPSCWGEKWERGSRLSEEAAGGTEWVWHGEPRVRERREAPRTVPVRAGSPERPLGGGAVLEAVQRAPREAARGRHGPLPAGVWGCTADKSTVSHLFNSHGIKVSGLGVGQEEEGAEIGDRHTQKRPLPLFPLGCLQFALTVIFRAQNHRPYRNHSFTSPRKVPCGDRLSFALPRGIVTLRASPWCRWKTPETRERIHTRGARSADSPPPPLSPRLGLPPASWPASLPQIHLSVQASACPRPSPGVRDTLLFSHPPSLPTGLSPAL